MIRRLVLFTVALTLVLSCVQAADVPDIAYKKYVLSNGLTLLVHEDHKAPIVAVNVWYHVGSKNERLGKTGFAHLFEHLMFNGSEHFNDDYFKAVEPIGATDLNGTTNNDRTNYFQNVPVSALDRILWLESDRMGHLVGAIDQARLDEQRGVVQNEKRQGENQPYGKAYELLEETTFPPGHPYSWSVIGSMEDLNAASLDDVKHWFQSYYGAANATLVIAGDVSADDVKQRVERFFGDIPPGPPVTAYQAWVPKMVGERRETMQDFVPQARVFKAWNVPQYGSADLTYLDLALKMLGGDKTSRFYKRLVYRDRIASEVSAQADEREIAGMAIVDATVQRGSDLKTVERALNEELHRFLTTGPTQEELDRVKTQERTAFVKGIERIGGFGGKSDILATGQVFLGDPSFYKKEQERIANATTKDILDAAKRWLSDGVFVLEVTPRADYHAHESTVDRSKLPDVAQPPAAPLPAPQHATLPNGLHVVLSQRSAVPMVRLSTVIDGGFAADPVGKPGVAGLAAKMLDEGTQSRNALQIADELASLGADLNVSSTLDATRVTLSVLHEKLDPALALYTDVLLKPSFPAEDLKRVKQLTLAQIQQEKAQPFSMGLRLLPPLLYGEGHAYAQPLTGSGTEQSIAAISREDLIAFHRNWFKPNHATLIAVGDISLAELTSKLERALASWRPGDEPTKNIAAVTVPSQKRIYLVDKPGAEQSIVLAGTLIPPKADAGDLSFQLFNDAIGGAFVSRLNMNLREDKHWSYGASSVAVDARGPRIWVAYAPVQTDKTKQSIEEMFKELSGVLTSHPLKDTEIADAKDRKIKTLAGRWETANAVRDALTQIATFNLSVDYYATYADKMRAVTDSSVNATGRKYLDIDKFVWMVIGDRAKIEADIKALNMGDVVLLDTNGKPIAAGR